MPTLRGASAARSRNNFKRTRPQKPDQEAAIPPAKDVRELLAARAFRPHRHWHLLTPAAQDAYSRYGPEKALEAMEGADAAFEPADELYEEYMEAIAEWKSLPNVFLERDREKHAALFAEYSDAMDRMLAAAEKYERAIGR
jgi:hypothetical protein